MYDTLVFSSGGNYCSLFLGALKAIENFQDLDKINNYIGCSGGGLVALLILIGYKPIELIKIIKEYDMSSFYSISIFNIFSQFGFNNFNKLKKLIISLFIIKNINLDITFNLLEKKLNKNLILIGSNLTKKKISVFSKKKTPNMKIIDAVRITCSIPFIFEPVIINDNIYVDGALFCNFPIYLSKSNKTLGLKLNTSKNNNKINNFKDYILLFSKLINKNKKNVNNKNIINFVIENKKLSIILNKEDINILIKKGYNTTNKYLFNITKKKRILNKYFYLLLLNYNLTKLKKNIK